MNFRKKLLYFVLLFVLQQSLFSKTFTEEEFKVYADALLLTKRSEKLKAVLAKEFERKELTVAEVKYRIDLAESLNFNDLIVKGYKLLLEKEPNNATALKSLSEFYYYSSEYGKAINSLNKYVAVSSFDKDDYNSFFKLADSYFWLNNYTKSDTLFNRVISIINSKKQQTLFDLNIKGIALTKLVKVSKTKFLFNSLLYKNPKNIELRLSYLSSLIFFKYYDEANKVQKQIDKLLKELSDVKDGNYSQFFISKSVTAESVKQLKQRCTLSKIQFYLAFNSNYRAYKLAEKFIDEYPNSFEGMSLYAETILGHGGYLEAISYLESINKERYDKGTAKRIAEIKNDHSSFMRESLTYITTDTSEIAKNEFNIRHKLSDKSVLGIRARQANIKVDDVSDKKGKLYDFDGNIYRNDIYYEYIFDSSNKLRFTTYFGSGSEETEDTGASLSYTANDFWGDTTLALDFRKPYDGTTESIVKGGNRDRIGLSRNLNLIPNWSVFLSTGLNRYNLPDKDDICNTFSSQIYLAYELPKSDIQHYLFGHNSLILLTYSLDYENRYEQSYSRSTYGDDFLELLLEDRLVQGVGPVVIKRFSKYSKIEAGLGVANDIKSDNDGEYYNIRYSKKINDELELALFAQKTITTEESSSVGFDIIWKY